MREPARVADLCAAMAAEAGGVPITVKCRVGVVDRDDVGKGPGLSERLDLDEVRRGRGVWVWNTRGLCCCGTMPRLGKADYSGRSLYG